MDDLPVGADLPGWIALVPDRTKLREGKFVSLEQLRPSGDSQALFDATHGDNADPGQWTYMGFGPFSNTRKMHEWMVELASSSDPLYFAVRNASSGEPLGMLSFLNIVPQHRTIELGNIWYAPLAQRSPCNTESTYLMLKECFDILGYRRVEWKCDALNARSRSAALRLGFSFEGIFRQHFIVKGRNRDTAWYAILDGEWPRIRRNLEHFLYDPDCIDSLGELNA